MNTLVLLITAGLLAGPLLTQETGQEKPAVPKDSIELVVIGCLKGRVLKAVEGRQADVENSPLVGGRSFRLAGKKDVMDEVKRQDGHLVEVGGLVKRSALDDKGVQVGKRVAIGGGSPVSGVGGKMPSAAENVVVMDATSVRLRSASCTGQ
jgi:hypothetical protein